MDEEEISYTIPYDSQAGCGCNVDVTLSYDGTVPNSDGSFTATDATGTYQTFDSNGNTVNTDQITSLAGTGQLGANDNEIFVGQQPFVTSGGVTFLINQPSDSNDSTGQVNFYYDSGNYMEDGANPNAATNVKQSKVDCFVTKTRICTQRGDIEVEALTCSDRVLTASGTFRAIKWIGCKTIDGKGSLLSPSVSPVQISAGAFDVNLPKRQLSLSPGHPVLVGDGVDSHLVPIMCLINGVTIVQVPVTRVTYWHVELDAHDILFAEGLAVESYLKRSERRFFTDDLGGDAALQCYDEARCRRVAVDGDVVEIERRRLDRVLAERLAAACAWPTASETSYL